MVVEHGSHAGGGDAGLYLGLGLEDAYGSFLEIIDDLLVLCEMG